MTTLTLGLLATCIFIGIFAGGITFGIRKNKVRDEITATAEARWRIEEEKLLHKIKYLESQIPAES